MKKLVQLSILAVMLLFSSQMEAKAQVAVELGPRIGLEVDNVETPKVGADLRIMTLALPLVINPTFDFYLSDSGSVIDDGTVDGLLYENMFQFTINALYSFGVDPQVFTPYAGPGLSVVHTTFPEVEGETEIGLNLVGGLSFFLVERIRPFIQGEFVVGGDIEPASVTGGVMFSLN